MSLNPRIQRQLETLTIESKRKFLGQRHGIHRSIKRGQGLEFSDYRKYELGDNPRHIDWGIYGRSDRLYVKRFLEDQDLSLIIVVDASGSMTDAAAKNKWLFAKMLTEAMAYVALMAQDSVRLVVPGSSTSPRFTSPSSYYSAQKFLDELPLENSQIRTGNHLVSSFSEAASLVRFPGVALIISDCLYPFETFASAVSAFRAQNLEIHLIQVLSSLDVDPVPTNELATIVDRETQEEISIDLTPKSRELYQSLLQNHFRIIEKFCGLSQIGYVRTIINHSVDELIIPTLMKTGLLE